MGQWVCQSCHLSGERLDRRGLNAAPLTKPVLRTPFVCRTLGLYKAFRFENRSPEHAFSTIHPHTLTGYLTTERACHASAL